MRSKLPWPFIAVIICSFVFGAVWGWKLLRDRASKEGRLEAEARLRVLAPPGIFSPEMLLEFQRREKIEVELTTEVFPGSLLRRALKSAPGQYDLVLVYHYQVSALRAERKLAALFDSRLKFPTAIAPDFRKLPNDRNLMDTAPLLWGLLGTATKKEFETLKAKIAFWPAVLIGMDDGEAAPTAFAAKMQPLLGGFDQLEGQMRKGPAGFSAAPAPPPTSPVVVSHASLAFSPYQEMALRFEPLIHQERERYPLWILTAVAVADGDIERARKFVRFLLEPTENIRLVQTARIGATTLREQPGLESLPKLLQASYFRTFSIDKIFVERDERVRNADDVLEQMAQGASLKVRPTPASPANGDSALARTPSPAQPKRQKATPPPASGDEEPDTIEDGPAAEATTVPSEPRPHDD